MKAQSLVGATAALVICLLQNAYAEQPPAPCHPNPNAAADSLTVRTNELVSDGNFMCAHVRGATPARLRAPAA
jgi:hypothetical protein